MVNHITLPLDFLLCIFLISITDFTKIIYILQYPFVALAIRICLTVT